MKRIKYFLWFMKESKKFVDCGYIKLIFKEGAISKGISFVKDCIDWDKAVKKDGAEMAYVNLNRVI